MIPNPNTNPNPDPAPTQVQRLHGIPLTGTDATLAVDTTREIAYVADPTAQRVLAVDYTTGDCTRSAREDYPIYSSSEASFEYVLCIGTVWRVLTLTLTLIVCIGTVWRVFAVVPGAKTVAVYEQGVYVLAESTPGTASVLVLSQGGGFVGSVAVDSGAHRMRRMGDRLMLVYTAQQRVVALHVSHTVSGSNNASSLGSPPLAQGSAHPHVPHPHPHVPHPHNPPWHKVLRAARTMPASLVPAFRDPAQSAWSCSITLPMLSLSTSGVPPTT